MEKENPAILRHVFHNSFHFVALRRDPWNLWFWMDSAPLPRITGLKSGSDFEWHSKWQLLGKASYSACLLAMTMTRTDATQSVWHVTALIIRTPAHKSRITIPGLHSLGTERKHTRWHSKSFKSLTVSALFCSEKPSLHFHCSVWETKGLHIVLLHFFFCAFVYP